MNKTTLVVIGSLVLAGIGAYFYFKPKANSTDIGQLGSTDSELNDGTSISQISVPPKGTVLSTPEEVAETAQKISDAKIIALQIKDFRNQIAEIKNQLLVTPNKNYWGSMASVKKAVIESKISVLNTKISDLEKLIKDLGYAEVNGSIVKIV